MVEKNKNRPDAGVSGKVPEKISEPAPSLMEQDPEKKNFLDMTALIRSIQRAEGHSDCFRKGTTDCDLPDCKWRAFCLEDHQFLNRSDT